MLKIGRGFVEFRTRRVRWRLRKLAKNIETTFTCSLVEGNTLSAPAIHKHRAVFAFDTAGGTNALYSCQMATFHLAVLRFPILDQGVYMQFSTNRPIFPILDCVCRILRNNNSISRFALFSAWKKMRSFFRTRKRFQCISLRRVQSNVSLQSP